MSPSSPADYSPYNDVVECVTLTMRRQGFGSTATSMAVLMWFEFIDRAWPPCEEPRVWAAAVDCAFRLANGIAFHADVVAEVYGVDASGVEPSVVLMREKLSLGERQSAARYRVSSARPRRDRAEANGPSTRTFKKDRSEME